jgi:DNA-binding transcriptional regulator YiaG
MTSTNSNSLKLQDQNSFATKKFEIGAKFRPMTTKDPRGRFAPTSIRMRAIRRASAFPAPKAFADFLGISVSRLSNVETGHPIGRQLQDIIVAKIPFVTRSYLMDGDEESLTVFTLQRLRPLLEEEMDKTRPRSRSRAGSAG